MYLLSHQACNITIILISSAVNVHRFAYVRSFQMTAISSRFAGNKNDTKESLLDSNITCMLIVSKKRAFFFS